MDSFDSTSFKPFEEWTEDEFKSEPNCREIYKSMTPQERRDHPLPLFWLIHEMDEEERERIYNEKLEKAKIFMDSCCRIAAHKTGISLFDSNYAVVLQNDYMVLKTVLARFREGSYVSVKLEEAAVAFGRALNNSIEMFWNAEDGRFIVNEIASLSPSSAKRVEKNRNYMLIAWHAFVKAKLQENVEARYSSFLR